MEIRGKIIKAFDVREGVSDRGSWMIASYLLETQEQYSKKMLFEISGEERIKRCNVQGLMSGGAEVVVYFDIDAHEWNGKWFNQIRAYDVRLANDNAPTTAAEANAAGGVNTDDLPFG